MAATNQPPAIEEDVALRNRRKLIRGPLPKREAPQTGRRHHGAEGRTLNPDEALLMQLLDNSANQTTQEDLYTIAQQAETLAGGGILERGEERGIIQHSTMPLIAMWKPLSNGTYMRRVVPIANAKLNHDNGWLLACPACGDDCGPGINACPEGERHMWLHCDVCAKPIRDPGPPPRVASTTGDPFEMQLPQVTTTPEQRLYFIWRRHMLAFHPQEAEDRGLLTASPRDDLSSARVIHPREPDARERAELELARE